MNKKNVLIIVFIIVIVIILGIYFLSTGRARTDVYLKDFKVSEDGKTMTLNIGVSSSAGYVRKMKRTSGGTNYYYTFYSTYGINSKIGAKDTFEIELDQNADEIYFYTGGKGYKLVLAKYHPTQEWEKVNYADTGKIKINLLNKEDIKKVGINTGAQNNNYFEYSDKYTIEKIYNIFVGLETTTPSTTVNPEGNKEIYAISFDTDEDKDRFEWYVDIYKRDDKYYVEQRYNGIYEVSEDDFNLIKSYIKTDNIEYEKATIDEIELKTEVDTSYLGLGGSDPELVKYKVYVENNKLYAKKIDTNEEKVIFDKESVKNIAVRKICCTGDGYLLILTVNGNVYMSEKDCNYGFSFNFPFKKLDAKDIVSFKLIPVADYDLVKNLYGVDSKENEILLHKMN